MFKWNQTHSLRKTIVYHFIIWQLPVTQLGIGHLVNPDGGEGMEYQGGGGINRWGRKQKESAKMLELVKSFK
ncbi:hypothetical protein ACFFIS_17805 [Virgibacillus soli]|uniref:Uncharacterized protein n=1 Tax=Paracerasibacillus soli TaxID=480284 RepID=A0ABU5CS20_9BACI|nr:hypothetical protein [Virgibacillus soli]MDY0409177.1 hypothetical protein [Virgibacillus soli]